jgi:hypothetical protein
MSQILMLALGDGNCARTAYAVLEKAKAMKRSEGDYARTA